MNVDTIFLTNRNDVSIDYLIGKYQNISESYLRIDSEDINLINFQISPGSALNCYAHDKHYNLDKVKSVVFRRVPSSFENENDGEDRPYLNGERKHFLEGLFLCFSNAKWINPMFATQIAERKLYQLQVAAKLGLNIPKSFVGNKLSNALDFLSLTPETIIKPISNGLQVLPDKVYSIYTTQVNRQSFEALGLAETFDTPVFLQEKIVNQADIRVTIVGKTAYPVEILKKNDEVDWRKPEIVKEYKTTSLPTHITNKLLELNQFFGLVYSAIDLIRTPGNQYVFLEINPVGEWVWLERELNLDISAKLIKELI